MRPHPHLATGRTLRTGARPTPRYKLAAATPFRPTARAPAHGPAALPPFLEMWLNDTYGDCVTAEEAAAKAMYAVTCGQPETKITDATVKAFCDAYGFLDGATLTDVMDRMIADGFRQDQGYKDGPYLAVDYSNEAVLQAAITVGPVKLGCDAAALPAGAGNRQGWTAFGGSPGEFSSEDHSTGLWSYGPTQWLADLVFRTYRTAVTLPTDAPTAGYLFYTWSTVGIVDHAWLLSTLGEAWVRNPTTPGVGPTPPPPPPDNSLGALAVTQSLSPGAYSLVDPSGNPVGAFVGGLAVSPGTYAIQGGPPPSSVGSVTVTQTVPPGIYLISGVGPLTLTAALQPGATYPVAPQRRK